MFLLKQINNIPRKPNLFVDNYSLRDNETNLNILELNNKLKMKNMDSTKINEKINEFLVNLEQRKKNQLLELERLNNFKIEDRETDKLKKQIKINFANEINDSQENILENQKIITKFPVDISNQTVIENYNVFKQFKNRFLDKKQEENCKVKPMTAGQFLNEKPKDNREYTNDFNKESNTKNPIVVEGLSKLLKENPNEIKKILERQSTSNNQISNKVIRLSNNNIKGKLF